MLEELQMSRADAAVDAEPTTPEHKPTSRARKPLPEHLPRETIEHGKCDCCEQCGNTLDVVGEDVSEQLEYVPSSFRVIRHVRPKYSCTHCDVIVQASAPSRPIARGYAGPGLLGPVNTNQCICY